MCDAGGHYTAFVHHSGMGQWLHCDDGQVTCVAVEVVLSQEAYMLMYEQVVP